MINTILENISWDDLGTEVKEKGKVSLLDAAVVKAGRGLSLTLGLNFVVPFSDYENICSTVRDKINDGAAMDIEEVSINCIYEPLVQPADEACKAYVEYMIMKANGEYAAVTKTIMPDHAAVSGDELRIPAIGQLAVDKLNKEVA